MKSNENALEREFGNYALIVKIIENASLWDFDSCLLMGELIDDVLGIGKLSDNAIQLLKEGKDTLEKIIGPVASPVWTELGLAIQDPLRRLRAEREINWMKRLGQAGKYIEQAGLEYKPVDLKTIDRLREFSSLEEDASLQDKWARLIASAATQGTLPISSILILGEISPEEARILDFMYAEIKSLSDKDDLKISTPINKAFQVSDLQSIDSLDEEKIKVRIDNLFRLNLCRIGGFHGLDPLADQLESTLGRSSFDAFITRTIRQESLNEVFRAMDNKINRSISEVKYDPDMIYKKISLTPLGFECVTLWNGPSIPAA